MSFPSPDPSAPVATFSATGARIDTFRAPDGTNIVLGFPKSDSYAHPSNPFFGETIGRVANRIKHAKINLAGKEWSLAKNDGGVNTLHGGNKGWGKLQWNGPKEVERKGRKAQFFERVSPHLEEGFPGSLQARAWFYVSEKDVEGKGKVRELELEYESTFVEGDEDVQETAVSMTNHSYFNLAPHRQSPVSIRGTRVTLPSTLHQEVDDTSIPTGPITPFPGMPEDGKAFTMGESQPDPDHCFVAVPVTQPSKGPAVPQENVPLDTRSLELRRQVLFYHPDSNISLEVLSTEPAFQFYSGRFMDVPSIDGQPALGARSGFCVESSRFIDAASHDGWRNQVLLKRGDTWGSRTVWKTWMGETA